MSEQTSHVAVKVERLRELIEGQRENLQKQVDEAWDAAVRHRLSVHNAWMLWWPWWISWSYPDAKAEVASEISRGRRDEPGRYLQPAFKRLTVLARMCDLSADGVVHLSSGDVRLL